MTDLESRGERGWDKWEMRMQAYWRGGGCMCVYGGRIKTKREAKQRQMEVVGCREMVKGKEKDKEGETKLLIPFKRLIFFLFVHFCYPSCTIKI